MSSLIGLGFTGSAKSKDESLKCPSTSSDYTFQIYLDAEEKYRWNLESRNGRIVGDSGQGYASKAGCEEAINRIKQEVTAAASVYCENS